MINKRTIGLVAVLAVILALVIAFSAKKERTSPPSGTGEIDLTKTSPEPRIASQDAQNILAGFPEGFPVEEGYQSNGAYKYVPANSLELQSTLEYVSKKTLAENVKIFSDYLKEAGFKVANKLNEPALVFYYATKDNSDLSIRLQLLNNQVTVTASYLER